jgi:chromosome segregation ATPase
LLKEKTEEYENFRQKDLSLIKEFEIQLKDVGRELEGKKDYDELKQQLSVIKTIELDNEDGSENLSIEQLLSQKNKKLQGQLMEMKHLREEQDEKIAKLKESLSKSESRVISLTTLVANLEADVVKLNQVLDSKSPISPKVVI